MTNKIDHPWFVECPDYIAGPFRTRETAEHERESIETPVRGRGRLCWNDHVVTDTPSHAPGSTHVSEVSDA